MIISNNMADAGGSSMNDDPIEAEEEEPSSNVVENPFHPALPVFWGVLHW